VFSPRHGAINLAVWFLFHRASFPPTEAAYFLNAFSWRHPLQVWALQVKHFTGSLIPRLIVHRFTHPSFPPPSGAVVFR